MLALIFQQEHVQVLINIYIALAFLALISHFFDDPQKHKRNWTKVFFLGGGKNKMKIKR